MSGKKRKPGALFGVQELYDSITDLLIQIKPKLSGDKAGDAGLVPELHKLANLAESFTELRPRSNKSWLSLADNLDREGVNLWNTSGILRQGRDQDNNNLKLFAALRLAAFRLVEAGLEQKPGIETLLHVLQLASKTGSALSDVGAHDIAGAVLGAAAKHEEALNHADSPENTHAQAKARAILVYYTSRMEAAWKEGNEGVAQFMLRKITGTEAFPQRLSYLLDQDREQLASKILEIGKAIAKEQSAANKQKHPVSQDGRRAQDAIKWIQKALALVEKMTNKETLETRELKRVILRNLARVYYLASSTDEENLSKAEATLHELITSIDDACDRKSTEFQQVRWMRLAVLKKRHAPDNLLLEAFQSIIEYSGFAETEVSDVLQELRGMAQHHVLVVQVNQHLLNAALTSRGDVGRSFVDRILLALIFHCSRDQDHTRAIKTIEDALICLTERGDYELPKVPTTACQSLLWQFGDRHYNAKSWSKAADWFLLGTHDAFKSMTQSNQTRCLRKAALCYIQQQEYARATNVIRRCRNNEAATYYVVFLTAVHQGLEDEAICAIQEMVRAKDFDRKMLLLATQLAHDAGFKMLLLTVLDSLLNFLQTQGGFDDGVEALTLVRCIIRLVLALLKQPAADLKTLVPTLIRHFQTAKTIAQSASEKKESSLIFKDLSWLWRTAYNVSVQGCTEWEDSEHLLSELFHLSRAFMEAYCEASITNVDPTVYTYIILASFSSISCRVFAVRQLSEDSNQTETRRKICQDIQDFKTIVKAARGKGQIRDSVEDDRVCSLTHIILVFETEQRCILKDWEAVLTSIEEASQSLSVKADTFEAMADILWVEKDCPVNVLHAALEAILHVCLDRNCMSVEKFSRWLRAICTILLARNTPADRARAVGYVEQGVGVIEDDSRNESANAYPIEERQWLLSTSYNIGVECLAASHLDEAKRWFESATVISRYVSNGKEQAHKISETYGSLLARYGA
ncbi:SPO22-domain-containing protein [Ramaria rubella]|nr:SPO22-domain-containing protein [Ramaria rubella]